jgi:hypothetical protein
MRKRLRIDRAIVLDRLQGETRRKNLPPAKGRPPTMFEPFLANYVKPFPAGEVKHTSAYVEKSLQHSLS